MANLLGKNNKLVTLHFSNEIDIASLGPNSVAKTSAGPLMTQRFRISRVAGWVGGDGLDADVGPQVFGLTDDQLSLAEIDECMFAIPTRENDSPMMEEALREVFPLAALMKSDGGGGLMRFDTAGPMALPFPGKTVEIGDNIAVFAWNADQNSTNSVTMSLNFYMKIWGVWVS